MNYLSLNQTELISIAQQKIIEVFPKEEQHTDIYYIEKKNYSYFSAMWYFKAEIITPDLIQNLTQNAALLSVGCGEGHLERLLNKGFDIPKKNIHTSDLYLDQKIFQAGFRHHLFDLTSPWPNLKKKFDYILFPESLGVALLKHDPSRKQQDITFRFFNYLEQTQKEILGGNLNPPDLTFFLEVVEKDVPRVTIIYNILKQAISFLKPQGEIRIKHGLQEPQQRAYIMAKLAQEYQQITYPNQTKSYENFILKMA